MSRGIRSIAKQLQSAGRDGDTILAHINPEEARLLKEMGGRGTRNPVTGLPEFAMKREAFDADLYAALNEDLFKQYGRDADALWNHYVNTGRSQGLAANANEWAARKAGYGGTFAGNWGEAERVFQEKGLRNPGNFANFQQWAHQTKLDNGLTPNQNVGRYGGYYDDYGAGGHLSYLGDDFGRWNQHQSKLLDAYYASLTPDAADDLKPWEQAQAQRPGMPRRPDPTYKETAPGTYMPNPNPDRPLPGVLAPPGQTTNVPQGPELGDNYAMSMSPQTTGDAYTPRQYEAVTAPTDLNDILRQVYARMGISSLAGMEPEWNYYPNASQYKISTEGGFNG